MTLENNLIQAMIANVYIDNCVWDLLFRLKLDLSVELPKDEYNICITREAEFEIQPTPTELKYFIENTIAKCCVQTTAYFGFGDPNLPSDEQRCFGFDQGNFISCEEIAFIKDLNIEASPARKRPTKLYKNEADVALAARSLRSIVLTLDKKHKGKQPLYIAYKKGGKVVFLNEFKNDGISLKDFIKNELQ